jgi:alpha/beta superfamily hydrolase
LVESFISRPLNDAETARKWIDAALARHYLKPIRERAKTTLRTVLIIPSVTVKKSLGDKTGRTHMPEVIFSGPDGRLEGRYHPQKDRDAPIAIVLHPHPAYGGTMNNKVVYNLHYAFYNLGFTVLRFNFRGVGRSQGEYDQGIGELSDAASALDYLQSMNQNSKHCWVAGFSFGAWIGMQLLMRRPEITGFISVAPPANLYDFSFLAPCPSSGLIINGSADKVAPPKDTKSLVGKLHEQKGITITHTEIEGADHFFKDEEAHMKPMINTVSDYVRRRLGEVSR